MKLSNHVEKGNQNRLKLSTFSYSVWVSFMHNPHTWSDLNPLCIICMVCEQPAVDGQSVAAVTNKK